MVQSFKPFKGQGHTEAAIRQMNSQHTSGMATFYKPLGNDNLLLSDAMYIVCLWTVPTLLQCAIHLGMKFFAKLNSSDESYCSVSSMYDRKSELNCYYLHMSL